MDVDFVNFIVVGKEWQVLGFQRGSLNIIKSFNSVEITAFRKSNLIFPSKLGSSFPLS